MSDWSFTIPSVSPGVNHGYRVVNIGGHCRLAKVPEVEVWQDEVAWRTKLARPKDWTPGRRIQIDYSVWFARGGRDADGILKFLLDGIAAGLGVNDSTFLFSCLSNEVDKLQPRVEVTIRNAALSD